MFTYAVYNFILIGATLSAYLYERAKSENAKLVFLFVSFLIPFFFLAIRYDIGTDYQSYVDYFYRIARGEFVPKEPGYILLNELIAYLHMDVQWLFVVFGFLYLFFSYKALPKEGFAFGVFLLISISYLYEGFSAIRQGVAVAIMAYAIQYIQIKQFKKYLLWSIVAMMFHLAAGFLLLLVYPLVNKKFNKYVLIILIVFVYIAVRYTHVLEAVLHAAVSLFPKYAWYLDSKYMQPSGVGSGLGVLYKIFIALTAIFFKDKISAKHPHANVVINMYVLYILFLIFRMKIMLFGRMEHIFVFAPILAVVYLLNTFESKSKILVTMLVFGVYYVSFMKYISTGTGGDNADAYVNPYQTMLQIKNRSEI